MTFPLYKEIDSKQVSFGSEVVGKTMQLSQVSDLFFSSKNVDALQEAIRYQVYVKSGNQHIIDRQSVTDLKIVMRSIYLEYGRNLPYDIVGQVKSLNARVLDYVVEKIINEINMYMFYKQDIQNLPVPLERSANVSSAGKKTLILREL